MKEGEFFMEHIVTERDFFKSARLNKTESVIV